MMEITQQGVTAMKNPPSGACLLKNRHPRSLPSIRLFAFPNHIEIPNTFNGGKQ
jgi:hypothetical protein